MPRRVDVIKWLSEMMLEGHDEAAGGTLKHLRALWGVWDAASKVEASGILCDPGCCGDGCGCADLRAALKAHDKENPR